jgi:general secretion pathway protein J
MRRSPAESGFTLVELLVSLLIFGTLAAASVALLSFSVRAQAVADVRLDELGAFRRASALLAADIGQAAPRVTRDEAGEPRPAFIGGNGEVQGLLFAFVRRGWQNVDEAPRPSLQRVEYLYERGRLERRAYRFLDGAEPLPPTILVEGVRRVRLRYRDREGEWRERWDPTAPADLPRAVELVVDAEGMGSTRQLFLSGPGR